MAITKLDFEGEPIKKIVLALTGSAEQADFTRSFKREEEIVLLVRGAVGKIEFAEKENELARIHKVNVNAAYLIEEGDAYLLLDELRERDARRLDELLGRQQVDGWDDNRGDA